MKGRLFSAMLSIISTQAMAQMITIDMIDLETGKSTGQIVITENQYGTLFTPRLTLAQAASTSSGLHGFHVHQYPSCASSTQAGKTVVGGAAGGHYDPAKTGKHGSPWTDNNHLGDLPPLYVDRQGKITQPVLAPRIKLSDLKGRSLMVHVGGDNHSDHPAPLGGGGARMLCGVIL